MDSPHEPPHTFSQVDCLTWETLFSRQLELVENHACREWQTGFKRLKLDPARIPDQKELSRRINRKTGWRMATDQSGFANNDEWHKALSQKTLLTNFFIRKPSELDFTPLPDLFHDYFGHAPFLMVETTAELYGLLAKAYWATPQKHRNAAGRLWWHTTEWGFVRENNDEKVFGAGLLAGKNDFLDAVRTPRKAFDLTAALQSPKVIRDVQGTYFQLESIAAAKRAIKAYLHIQKHEPETAERLFPKKTDADEIDQFRKTTLLKAIAHGT